MKISTDPLFHACEVGEISLGDVQLTCWLEHQPYAAAELCVWYYTPG